MSRTPLNLTILGCLLATLGLASSSVLGVTVTTPELIIDDGVVVKFGAASQLVVRSKASMGKGAVLTSQNDNNYGGAITSQTVAPKAGDWSGVRIEKSAATYGFSMNDSTVRYAGGDNMAGLYVRGFNPTLTYPHFLDNSVGLRLLEGASPSISGGSFLRNDVAVLVGDNSHASITGSDFTGNVSYGVNNQTPTSVITATSNWWGDASGPKDAVNNAAGLGAVVSIGVNYAGWSTVIPLINPQISLVGGGAYVGQPAIQINLACQNAVEYRIAENANFTGLAYLPITTTTPFTLSSGDGSKSLSVQYRASTGNTITQLMDSVTLDTASPTVSITNPANGSYISKAINIDASATDSSGIKQVDFYIDGLRQFTDQSAPFSFAWDATLVADGVHVIKVVATDQSGRTSEVQISITKGLPPPDTVGPTVADVKLGALLVVDGITLTQSGTLSATASDPSGVASVEYSLDGIKLVNAYLDLYSIADGAHTLNIKATDTLGNITSQNVGVVVALAVPTTVPTIISPINGLLSSQSQLVVSGSGTLQTQVQLFNNGVSAGAPVNVDSTGKYSITTTLVTGSNSLTVSSVNRAGSSAQSAAVIVSLDASVPAAPTGLVAQSQAAGKIHLSWLKSGDAATKGYDIYRSLTTFNSIGEAVKINSAVITGTLYDDLPANDGTYYYRVVAVNSLGTPSQPTNITNAVADSTLPRASVIQYTPTGSYDSATGRFGRGRVNVTLTASELLLTTPFVSIVPQNGTPVTLTLTKTADKVYSSYFDITADTPSGTAWAQFSAYDLLSNRGTDIDVGQSILIDAQGPAVTAITLAPTSPVRTDSVNPVVITTTFTLSEAVKPGTVPQLSWQLSGTGRPIVPMTQLNLISSNTWQTAITMPADAGQNGSEFLHFNYQAEDDLGNTSTTIKATNSFEVYQGDLPAAAVPTGLTAAAQSGGKVKLSWAAVSDAAAYQLYRRAPGESVLVAYQRLSATSYIDSASVDGSYSYSIASIRSYNGQETTSAQSAIVSVNADGTPPGAPQSLSLLLLGTGIQASWLSPASGAATYNLYRSSAGTITSLVGLTPIKTGITQIGYVDANPSVTDHSYVVTAVDAAGNESDISNSAYLNFQLLPVNSINILQDNSSLPVISWTTTSQTIAGYDIYVGPDNAAVKLNDALLTVKTYTDTGYNANERRYNIVSVDSNNEKAARNLTLPKVDMQLTAGAVLKRNVMNRLTWQVKNAGDNAIYNAYLKLSVAGHDHTSATFSLSPGQTLSVPIVVGGYAELSNPANMVLSLISQPNEGEYVQINRNSTISVIDSSLTISQQTETFTRGGTGLATFTLSNTSDVDMEILTATGNGNQNSTEIRYKLIDVDGNVLATQSFKQALGSSVITLSNGQTVARIPAGANFISDPVAVAVPASAPDQVQVQLEIDKLHYHTGQSDQVDIGGMTNRKTVVLTDTAYTGVVDSLSPTNSFGTQDIIITGRAIDRKTNEPVANVPLLLALNVSNYERKFDIQTDSAGTYRYSYKPQSSDAGTFKVSVVHPSLLDRPVQGQFVINRLSVTPTQITMTTSRNYYQLINLTATTGEDSKATNVRLAYDAASQLTGTLPLGITVNLGNAVTLAAKQSVTMPISIAGNNDAAATGTVILDVYSDEFGALPFGKVRVDYTLKDSKPSVSATPSYIESGVSRDSSITERFTLKNNGLADAVNLKAVLLNNDGSAAPAWASLISPGAIGTLAAGQSLTLDMAFTPTSSVAEGIYNFKLHVTGDNIPTGDLVAAISVTQSGQGDVLFKASDIYTGTLDKNGLRVQGLAGARIRVQNELVPSIDVTLNTDVNGEVFFHNLAAGSYKYRATATNHQEVAGRFSIKPGVTATQEIFLDYNLVTVEWSVKEITIEDRYEITLNATYETDVPAAVVVMKPSMVNLPDMKAGDIFNGELTLTNYGLIRADNVLSHLPVSDDYIRYEFLSAVPTTLDSKQVFVLPYRAIAIKSFQQDGTSTGGGCFNYSNGMSTVYSYSCINGKMTYGATNVAWSRITGTCTGTSSDSIYIGGGSSGGGGGWGGGAPTYTSMPGASCAPVCKSCNAGNSTGGGQ